VLNKRLSEIVIVSSLVFLIIVICLRKQDIIKDLFAKKESSLFQLNDNFPVPEIEVISLQGFKEKLSFIDNREKSLIFIIDISCAPCEKNIAIGERLYQQIKGSAEVIGIVKGEIHQAAALKEAFKVQFPLYIPLDVGKFSKIFYTGPLDLTLLVTENGKIGWAKIGDLNADDYLNLKNLILKN